jgi:phosphoglycolate phosphatase
MQEFGYPLHTREEARSYINDGALKLIQRALPDGENSEENARRVLSRYLEIYDEHVNEKTVPYDGIKELIEKLKNDGVCMSVVSNKPERHVKLLAEYHFGKDTFSYISGTGADTPKKPDRICVEKAVNAMGISYDGLIYVGDSHVDVQTAHNAEIPCAGVTWGFHGKDGFYDKTPDFLIDNTIQLYELIKNGKTQ